MHRYVYTEDNPTSYVDLLGNLCARVNPHSDALPLGCGATPVQAHENVADHSKPPVAPQPPSKPSKPEATGPNSQNDLQVRHTLETLAALLQFARLGAFPPIDFNQVLGWSIPTLVGLVSLTLGIIVGLEVLFYSQLAWAIHQAYMAFLQAVGAAEKWANDNVSRPVSEETCSWMKNWLGNMGVHATC